MTTTTTDIPCRAKNPATCIYHGALLDREKAIREGNQKAYLEAQIQVDRAFYSADYMNEMNAFFHPETQNSTTPNPTTDPKTEARKLLRVKNLDLGAISDQGYNHIDKLHRTLSQLVKPVVDTAAKHEARRLTRLEDNRLIDMGEISNAGYDHAIALSNAIRNLI